MAILPFVLLVCNLAVDRLTSKIPPHTHTCIPNPFTAEVACHGSDEIKYGVAFTLCGNKQSHCAAFGHPLQEICCPPNTTGRGLAQAFSYIFCCPKAFSCCYLNEWHIPTPGGDGCCAFSLRCEPDLRFEYDDKMLAVIQRLPIHKGTSFNSQGLYNCPIPATIGPVKTPTLPSSLSTGQVVPKCASQTCQPGKNSQKDQVLRINDRTPGTQTAWRSMIDDIAAKSQAEEDWDGKNRKRRLRRLGCVVMALVVITLVMFIS